MIADGAPAPVWGHEEWVCPLTWGAVRRLVRRAKATPWTGTGMVGRRHIADTTAILEPGRPLRVIFTQDVGTHSSGWWANSDYDCCYHLSLSHPRPDRLRVYRHPDPASPANAVGIDLEAASDAEARAWSRVFFGEHHTCAWFEPAVGPLDPHRSPGVVHLRLFTDKTGRPVIPQGEVYTLRPYADGSSPPKITEGRAGADVR